MIEKIFGLSGMKYLKVLSLSRNYIKQISGLVGHIQLEGFSYGLVYYIHFWFFRKQLATLWRNSGSVTI